MHLIPRLDLFLAAFLALNLAFVLFPALFARGSVWLQRRCMSQSRRPDLLRWFSADELAGWSDPAMASKIFFWSGLINCIGIFFFRVFLVPHLQ